MTTRRSDFTPIIDLVAKPGTGPVRERRPIYVDLLPPCNNACPAGENIQAWLAHAQAGRHREAWLTLVRDNPLPAVHGRVCYHPCESHCNREPIDSAVSIHAVERFLGDMAAAGGLALADRRAGQRQARPGGRRRPERPVGGLSPGAAGPRGRDPRGRPAARRHAAFRHPRLPAAARGADEGGARASRRWASRSCSITRSTTCSAEMQAGRFDAAFLAIGAHVGKRVDIPARDAVAHGDGGEPAARRRHRRRPEARSPGRRLRRRQHGDGRRADRQAPRGGRGASSSTARDRAHMQAQAFEAEEAIEEGVKIKWLTSIKSLEGTDLTVEEMELGADGRPQPTGRLETLAADAVVLALGQETDSGFLRKIPGIEFQSDGVVVVAPNMMTGHPGIFAGGDMVPTERTVTAARRPRQEGGAPHRRLAARKRLSTGAEAPDRLVRHAAPAGLQRRRAIGADDAAGRGAHRRVRRGAWRASARSEARLRGEALPVLRQLLRVRPVLCGVPRAGDREARARPPATATSMTGAPAAPSASTPVRATRSR